MTREEELQQAVDNFSEAHKYDGNLDYLSMGIAFEEGVEWADLHPDLSALWHPAHTMPSIKSMPPFVYAIVKDDNIERLNMSNCGELSASMPELVWDFLCKMHKIKYWAYPQDILPREDDERGTADTAL